MSALNVCSGCSSAIIVQSSTRGSGWCASCADACETVQRSLRKGRRHHGILAGPTRGYQPPTWGYLLELLVEEGPIEIAADQQLLPHDADELADRSVLRTETIQEAFQWLVRHGLVATRMSAGRRFAVPDLTAVQDLLRGQQELELAGARASDLAALNYFRSRHVWVGLPWMGRVLGEERE